MGEGVRVGDGGASMVRLQCPHLALAAPAAAGWGGGWARATVCGVWDREGRGSWAVGRVWERMRVLGERWFAVWGGPECGG